MTLLFIEEGNWVWKLNWRLSIYYYIPAIEKHLEISYCHVIMGEQEDLVLHYFYSQFYNHMIHKDSVWQIPQKIWTYCLGGSVVSSTAFIFSAPHLHILRICNAQYLILFHSDVIAGNVKSNGQLKTSFWDRCWIPGYKFETLTSAHFHLHDHNRCMTMI